MKIKNIYDTAMRILGEPADNISNSDFEERAQYLAAAFCCEAATVDRDFRESHKLAPQEPFNEVFLSLEENFPLSVRFSKAAAHYIAAMLIIDENERLSDNLFEKYCDSLSAAVSEIPYQKHKIKNVYC